MRPPLLSNNATYYVDIMFLCTYVLTVLPFHMRCVLYDNAIIYSNRTVTKIYSNIYNQNFCALNKFIPKHES